MPSKKKKYNARFPPARIKKIMQTDEDVGKVAAAVPVIISRALELFIDSLIEKTATVTRAKNAKTLSSSHVKQAIHSEKTFDFLRDLVKNVPDHQTEEEVDTAAPSSSGAVEKKPKVQRPRKPREEGARGRGRPRKVKVEEKKDSASEVSDEETETDEEQTADEDSRHSQQYAQTQITPQGQCSTPVAAQGECSSQMIPPGQYDTQVTPQGQCSTQMLPQGQFNTQMLHQGQFGAPVAPQGQCSPLIPPQAQSTNSRDNSPPGTSMQQDPQQGSSAGTTQTQNSPSLSVQSPPQPKIHVEASPVISNIQGETTSSQHPAQSQSQPRMPMPQQFPPAGFPMRNMVFPQYPFMAGGQPLPYIHPQPNMGPLPSSSVGSNPIPQTTGTIPPQFIPGHPAYMMPQMGPNGPMLPMVPGMPVGPPPPLVPISTVKNNQDSDGDSNVPLDMSIAGKSRSQASTVQNPPASLSKIPTPLGMPPLTQHGFMPSPHPELPQFPHPQGFPHWRMNSQINQNFQETGFRSQISGPPPLVSSTVTQSTATVKENGKHKQNDDSAEIVGKKSKQKNTAENPGEDKTVSFPGLANIMNLKPVKTVQNNDDDDYDT
ncbi:uncharacterized protein LOC123533562 [Mercenaria mercenaria]|uniref:uncharacterized protein LOC123533562 n=1 Tax=Mercenaria mercenaria TaxID=6596 RepID=UPI00234F64BA|nr:uncharacterized protein LOC123533562 [Mercenaria mercenaria]